MVLAYTTVAFLISLALGIVVARISFQYEVTSQRNSLRTAARFYVEQMDETLGRMDAIMSYVLSDAYLLESITFLSQKQEGDVPNRYVLDSRSRLRIGLSSEFIMKNSYRTVFFNQNSFLTSSATYTLNPDDIPRQRLISDFHVEDVPYLEPVIAADGGSVIVTAHPDHWGVYGGDISVYSLMKALRGDGMGFLEVENRIDDLDFMDKPYPDTDFLIIVNGGELLHASDEEYGAEMRESDRELMESLQDDVFI